MAYAFVDLVNHSFYSNNINIKNQLLKFGEMQIVGAYTVAHITKFHTLITQILVLF